MKKAVLYSSVADIEIFKKVGFYRDDVLSLQQLGFTVATVNDMRSVIKATPAVVLSYFYSRSALLGFLCLFFKIPFIATGGADQISPAVNSGWKLLTNKVLALVTLIVSDSILVPCSDDYDNFLKLTFGLSALKRKIVISPHVVIPSNKDYNYEYNRNNSFRCFTICWMGAVENVRRKGVDKAIKIISLLNKSGIDASLVIAGTDGPGKKYLEELANVNGISERITFVCPINEDAKNKIFASNGIYLQLSTHEGFGVAAAEAFFSGMTVIHSNKGGLKEVVGERGIVFDTVDVNSIDRSCAERLYQRYLMYSVDHKYIACNIHKYSISNRSNFFNEAIND